MKITTKQEKGLPLSLMIFVRSCSKGRATSLLQTLSENTEMVLCKRKQLKGVIKFENVCDICENLDLVDAWRILNPEARRYTWRQSRPEIHCRLDFFLESQSLLDIVSSADILPGFKTDHSLITINISLHSNPRGRGFWKLNTSLLVGADYIDLIKRTIRQTKQE